MQRYWIALISLLALGSFAGPRAAAAPPNIRAFDFSNATYNDFCGMGALRLQRGEYRRSATAQSPAIEAHLVGVAFGDVLRDGATQAVVNSWCTAGGTGIFSHVSVYELKADGLVKVFDVASGDRSWGGVLHDPRIENGSIVVEQCLPANLCQYSKITTFRWNGKKFASIRVLKHSSGQNSP